MRKKLKSILTT